MTSTEVQQRIAADFIKNLVAGGVSAQHYADDMTAWSLVNGRTARDVYLRRLQLVGRAFSPPLEMTVDAVHAQLGWVAMQAHSSGQTITGAAYSNNYVFVVEFNDRDQIHHVREYCDLERAQTLVLAMQEVNARGQGQPASAVADRAGDLQ